MGLRFFIFFFGGGGWVFFWFYLNLGGFGFWGLGFLGFRALGV